MIICNQLDGFRINDDTLFNNEIGHELINMLPTIKNRIPSLLVECNPLLSELHTKGVLIGFFSQARAERLVYSQRTTDDSIDQFFLK